MSQRIDRTIHKAISTIDGWIATIGTYTSYLNVALILLICLDVLFRYVFSFSKNWIVELEWYIFSIVFLLGCSFALQRDKHVRVDLFYNGFSPSMKQIVNTLGTLLFLIPWAIVAIKTSYNFAMNSWYIKEGSAQPEGLPARYLIKFVIVVAFVLLLMQGISQLLALFNQSTKKRWKE